MRRLVNVEMNSDRGLPNANFVDDKVWLAMGLPPIQCKITEPPAPGGPFRASVWANAMPPRSDRSQRHYLRHMRHASRRALGLFQP
ncbi:hypothetical protein LMG23994_06165 [Cupriavidus pinatubonensis]|uniref:Uncharacterized protein n=1 Tax=Cupriavidus pinatubonensis TaxID=248026 RepID=A0ABM8Y148_9BURK|nr:hypothetical protein LMG23994_06165 [Cupriavidus pinatubonensis]